MLFLFVEILPNVRASTATLLQSSRVDSYRHNAWWCEKSWKITITTNEKKIKKNIQKRSERLFRALFTLRLSFRVVGCAALIIDRLDIRQFDREIFKDTL